MAPVSPSHRLDQAELLCAIAARGYGRVFVLASVSSTNNFGLTTPRHIAQMGDDARFEHVQNFCNIGARWHGGNAWDEIPGTYEAKRGPLGPGKESAMGLFDGFKQRTTESFNEQQAIMTIVIAAIKADGQISGEELQRLRGICALSPIFASNSADQDSANINFADMVTGQLGDQAVVKAAAALSPALRETAFVFASDMVLADGVLGTSEERFVEDLAKRLDIPENAAKAIIYANIARNRTLS